MVQEITSQQLAQFLQQGAELVDVRESEELTEQGLLTGGKHWPLSSFALRQPEVSQLRPTIFYCRSGLRSMQAAEIASRWTDQQVFYLHGGYLSYLAQDKTY